MVCSVITTSPVFWYLLEDLGVTPPLILVKTIDTVIFAGTLETVTVR